MPADARREPPSEARHGHGRPPDGPPGEEPWGFARGFRSLFSWSPSQAAPALPPLTASGLRAQQESMQLIPTAPPADGDTESDPDRVGFGYTRY